MRRTSQYMFAFLFLFSFSAFAENAAQTSIRDVIAHGLKTSPELRASNYELKALLERYPQALAGWRPTISADGQIYHSDIENSNFAGASGATTKDFGVNLEQPLFRGGRTIAETDRAKNLIRSASMSVDATRQNIILDILRVYIDVKRGSDLLALQKENERFILRELSATQERYKGGELTLTDVNQAQARLSDAQSRRLLAEAEFNNSRTDFERVTGLYPTRELAELTNLDTFIDLPSEINHAAEIAMQDNPLIQAAKFAHLSALDASDANLRALFPSLFAFASYNKQFDPQPGIVDQSENKTFGIRLRVPLYQGGAARSRVRESKYIAGQRKTDIDSIKRQVQSDFILAWRRYLTAIAEEKFRLKQVESAREARTGISKSAQMGERTVLDILDADREMIDAKVAMVNAQYRRLYAQAEVAHSMGHLKPQAFNLKTYNGDIEREIKETGGKILTLAAD